jgi:hypothetical protein
MSITVQDRQGVGLEPHTPGCKRKIDPGALCAVLLILSAISILVLVGYSIVNAGALVYEQLPDRVTPQSTCAAGWLGSHHPTEKE